MFNRISILILMSFLLIACSSKNEDTKTKLEIVELWKTESVFKIPECAIYDELSKSVYVSNINENPRQKDGNGFISKISKDGKKVELEWVKGLSSPKGMGLFEGTLYVTDTDEIVAINIEKAEIVKNIPFENVGMLNDITIDNKGKIYTSDMDSNKIYTYYAEEIELWKSNVEKPNGLFIDGEHLIVASFTSGKLSSYNISNKESVHIGQGLGKADGIIKVDANHYVVSDWNGELFSVNNSKINSIFDGKPNNVQTADIGFISSDKIILVPTFKDNRLIAFKILD